MSALRRASIDQELPAAISPLLCRLAHYGGFDPTCRESLVALFTESRTIRRRRRIFREGRQADEVFLLLNGWAACYQELWNGEKRQLTSLLLPGDVFPIQPQSAGAMDHAVSALTDCRVAVAGAEDFDATVLRQPKLAELFWWLMVAENNILRTWVTNLGHRSAHERIAHLLCELAARLQVIGLSDGVSFFCPLTQQELADALGLTVVHVNRMLRLLNAEDLIEWRGHQVTLLDPERLHSLVQFHSGYLSPGSSPSARKARK